MATVFPLSPAFFRFAAFVRPVEARFGRIFTNVSLHGAEVFRTADEAVEVIGLPEGIQGAEARLVDETARNAFPALERVGEGFAVAEGEEDMDVIRHDDVAPEVVALAVEVMEAVGDDLGEVWIHARRRSRARRRGVRRACRRTGRGSRLR